MFTRHAEETAVRDMRNVIRNGGVAAFPPTGGEARLVAAPRNEWSLAANEDEILGTLSQFNSPAVVTQQYKVPFMWRTRQIKNQLCKCDEIESAGARVGGWKNLNVLHEASLRILTHSRGRTKHEHII